MVERLHRAQDLLSHAVRRGDLTEVFDRGLKALIADLEKKKFAVTGRPRATKPREVRRQPPEASVGDQSVPAKGVTPPAKACPAETGPVRPRSRYVTMAVRRTVTGRDEERCIYVAPDGRRCTARAFLEFHHRRPFEVGGDRTVENIALLCRAHNQYEADVYFAPFREAMSQRDSIRPGAEEEAAGGGDVRAGGGGGASP
jgi:hypothetical protein